jgi:hypothetical protein
MLKKYFSLVLTLITFNVIAQQNVRDLSIKDTDLNNYVFINTTKDNKIGREVINDKKYAAHAIRYHNNVYKALNINTGEIDFYLRSSLGSMSGLGSVVKTSYPISTSIIHQVNNHIVLVQGDSLFVYNDKGKYLRNISRNYVDKANRTYGTYPSADFSEIVFIKDKDVHKANLSLSTGEITDVQQATYSGNYKDAYRSFIQYWNKDVVIAEGDQGFLWADLKVGKQEVVNSYIKTSQFDGYSLTGYRGFGGFFVGNHISNKTHSNWQNRNIFFCEHEERFINYFNVSMETPVLYYDANNNKFETYFTYKKHSIYHTVSMFPSKTLEKAFAFIHLDHIKPPFLQIVGKENGSVRVEKDIKLPKNWNGLFFGLSGEFHERQNKFDGFGGRLWISPSEKYIVANCADSRDGFEFNEVLDLATGYVTSFIDSYEHMDHFSWVGENQFVFALQEPKDINAKGLYYYDLEKKELKKIFNYLPSVHNNGETNFVSKINKENDIYIVANKFLWKWNTETGKITKMTENSENISFVRLYVDEKTF